MNCVINFLIQVATTIELLLIVSAIIISQDKLAIIFTSTNIEIVEFPKSKDETISVQEVIEAAKVMKIMLMALIYFAKVLFYYCKEQFSLFFMNLLRE
ncbi:27354_t:CDS:2 [Gigaspora margarita]|uniref:27354_t:CDS:1 n=1 Tax=Gigaspora margarita TaxID=4874 RepID=A0ABN7V9W5_GIGMA|nr:27354_t:CDS:2 [Gigaspora margarita]